MHCVRQQDFLCSAPIKIFSWRSESSQQQQPTFQESLCRLHFHFQISSDELSQIIIWTKWSSVLLTMPLLHKRPQEAQETAALLGFTAYQKPRSPWWMLLPNRCSSSSELAPLHHTQKYSHLLLVAPVLEKVQCSFFLHIYEYCIVEILAFHCPTAETGPLSGKA